MLVLAIGLPIARDLAIKSNPGYRFGLALAAYLALVSVSILFMVAGGFGRDQVGIGRPGAASLALGLLAGFALLLQPLTGHQLGRVAPAAMMWIAPAAAAEEFVFRGVLFAALERAGGVWLALVGSTAAFTLAHLAADPSASLILVLVLGAYLGLLRLLSSSLWAPGVAHILINAASLAP
jgi:membrane protease YdiL (CAAX protease family)